MKKIDIGGFGAIGKLVFKQIIEDENINKISCNYNDLPKINYPYDMHPVNNLRRQFKNGKFR